ncbi:MAG TPA: radical SAM protein [Terriglobales bacterium]|nr:radical SAM protein [Terriglobales bacterium]
MRVARVITNETCNQNCWFCNARRPAERPEWISSAAVEQRIAAAESSTPQEILLTGGEPTLRQDLALWIGRAARSGAKVTLESNASRIDRERAEQLAAAGLSSARVQLVAWGAEIADAITREPGGFAAAIEGIRALVDAGIAVEVTTPVVRRSVAHIAAIPAGLSAAAVPVSAISLVVPLAAPDAAECAPLAEVATAVAAMAGEARRVGLLLRFDPATFVPPCLFANVERIAHLFALNRGNASRGGYRRIAECHSCLVNDRCPGVPSTAAALPQPRPITEPRLRRRMTVVSSIQDQIARELVTRDLFRGGEQPVPEHTVRINFHCNQACQFCFVSTHLPPAQEATVREAIEEAGRAGAMLVLSGGEPTLNPRLVDYVGLGRRAGAGSIELQSNAIRLAEADLTEALANAGLDRAMVSLHGSHASLSDAITGAPGTFAATVRGIDELLRAGIQTRLNFVFCQANRDDFPQFVDLVASRWPSAGIVFSFVGSHTDVVPRTVELIPRFSEVLPSLRQGLARARRAGLVVTGFDSMCGMPLCLVPAEERVHFSAIEVGAEAGGGELIKGEACTHCSASHRCHGIRRGYAELYGTSELQPLSQ